MRFRSSLVPALLLSLLFAGTGAAARGDRGIATTATSAVPPPPEAAAATAVTPGDTLYLLGGPARGDGKFQRDDNPAVADDEGWAPLGQFDDGTGPYWHVSTFNADLLDPQKPENNAMWCGKYFLPCQGEPENPGYGNNVAASLVWSEPVTDPGLTTQVHLTARLNHDSEAYYDFLYLEVRRGEDWSTLQSWTDANKSGEVFVPVDVDEIVTLQPGEYTGELGNEIQLRWRFTSDGAYSDDDCFFQGDGAAQIDNIMVSFDQGEGPQQVTFDDFEPGNPVSWSFDNPLCSLARVWTQLPDVGVCGTNLTPQLAFLDDGAACFSPGSMGTDWTYGPGGLVVYCPGPFTPYTDQFWSPVIDLPVNLTDYDGARLEFDAYVHGHSLDTPTVFWQIRTSADGGVLWSAWDNLGVVYEQHGPEHRRYSFDVTRLIPADADKVQLALGLVSLAFFTDCSFVTPAPYYDNVVLKLFQRSGPDVYHNYGDVPSGLATGGFPASGTLDPSDLASHAVGIHSSFGDSIVVRVAVQRSGAVLAGPPELHWRLQANPLYDPYRTAIVPNPVPGDSVAGPVSIDGRGGVRYAFDFPETGFFFPGDVLRYYIRAEDDSAGDIGIDILPADTTGYATFPGMAAYVPGLFDQDFEVRALPSLHNVGGDQPGLLFWLHETVKSELDEWLTAWANLGYRHGQDFDFFKAPAASSPGATAEQLAGYDVIVYSTGRNTVSSLSGPEVLALEDWLAQGGKKLLICGDNAVSKLVPYQASFVTSYLGLDPTPLFDLQNVRPEIGDQAAPLVLPVAGTPLNVTTVFRADGSCYYNLFDALEPVSSALAILEWADPSGQPGSYAPAAGVYNHLSAWDSDVVTLPYDLAFAQTPADYAYGPIAARTRLLGEILAFFGAQGSGVPTGLPSRATFSVRCFPNPFNPKVKIAYNLTARGQLAVRIFNIRGELVRTLHDAVVPAGSADLAWDGRNDRNNPCPSGIYFCEVEAFDRREISKLALIR